LSAFIPILRSSFLYLSRRSWLRRFMETSRAAQSVTSRFVAGLTLDDGLRVCRELKRQGFQTSLDYLGENVHTLEEAAAARVAYLTALHRIHSEGLPSTVSMKVTALGLDISEDACRENTDSLARKAQQTGTRIEMDMEDSRYTDRNLKLVHEMHEKYGSVRAVIQAYLYRSDQDIRELCEKGIPVRLCKGAYDEPPSVAYAEKSEVDANYVRLTKTLLDRGAYPAIATHDETIILEAIQHIRLHNYTPDRFEFQMLYGVKRNLQKRLVSEGYRVRIYVPYGAAWYPYFMRRLAERPANVMFLLRNFLKG
jgi:proline dehydrogenase